MVVHPPAHQNDRALILRRADGARWEFGSVCQMKKFLICRGVSIRNFSTHIAPHGQFSEGNVDEGHYGSDGLYHYRTYGAPREYLFTLRFDDGEVLTGGQFLGLCQQEHREIIRKRYKFRKRKKSRFHSYRNLKSHKRQLKQLVEVGYTIEPPVRKAAFLGYQCPYDSLPDRCTPKSWKNQTKKRAQWARSKFLGIFASARLLTVFQLS